MRRPKATTIAATAGQNTNQKSVPLKCCRKGIAAAAVAAAVAVVVVGVVVVVVVGVVGGVKREEDDQWVVVRGGANQRGNIGWHLPSSPPPLLDPLALTPPV